MDKKAKQITAATVVIILLVAVYSFQVYQSQHTKPQRLFERLMRVASEAEQISPVDYNRERLAEQETTRVLNQLQQDLSAVKGLESQISAQYLLSEATAFLATDESFQPWLTGVLSQLWQKDSNWQMEIISKTERKIIAADKCLTLTRGGSRWQLSSISLCE
ncbi:hypothetical protein [Reinekea marinisedimentorum]|uniref:DUF2939 family protein n=1 Tax=Reinekea marinisedimentorum TaxID=230495 RepID=A0A4R3IE20_9GAMM|nr:hypothetical protein [Reinekea marinisedimentorum]TCS44026.1 hypothetical protein BCF53_101369 [Reinekea marinisedimentorum]